MKGKVVKITVNAFDKSNNIGILCKTFVAIETCAYVMDVL